MTEDQDGSGQEQQRRIASETRAVPFQSFGELLSWLGERLAES